MKTYDTMKRFALHLITVMAGVTLFLHGLPALGQAKDSLLGNWVLDRGNSVFDPDTTLQSRTVSFEVKDGGISFVQKTVTGQGNTVQSDFVAKYDGKDVPISGSQLASVALKRIDANTVERAGKIGGKVVETATIKVSNGGKTLTITTKGSVEDVDYSSTQIYEKQ